MRVNADRYGAAAEAAMKATERTYTIRELVKPGCGVVVRKPILKPDEIAKLISDGCKDSYYGWLRGRAAVDGSAIGDIDAMAYAAGAAGEAAEGYDAMLGRQNAAETARGIELAENRMSAMVERVRAEKAAESKTDDAADEPESEPEAE